QCQSVAASSAVMSDTTPRTGPVSGAVELPPPPPHDAGAAIVAAAELLWPKPAAVAVSRRRAAVPPDSRLVREYLLIPNAHRPRLMPPAAAPRSAAAIVRR